MKKLVMSFMKTILLKMLVTLNFNLPSFHAFGLSFPHFWHIYSMIFCGPTDCPEQND